MDKRENYIQQLADHIKRNIAKGYTMDSLVVSLTNQGYSRIAIEKSIELANKQLAEKAPLMKERPEITHKVILNDSEYELKPKKSFWKKLFGL
jgi:hypothetical protein